MNRHYLLLGMATLLGAGSLLCCSAQTPPQHLPVPVFIAPKPMAPKPSAAEAANDARPKAVWCPTCLGRKTVGVEVEVVCRTCAGTGKLKSRLSETESACNFCKGSGKGISIAQTNCPVCLAKGALEATVVEQFVACTNCNGTKTIEVDTTTTCTICKGTGKSVRKGLGSGGGLGSKSNKGSTVEQACPFCGAAGIIEGKVRKTCPTCYGCGLVPPPPAPPPAPAAG